MPNAILDPTGQTGQREPAAPLRLAPRRARLAGARVGLLINTKRNAAPFLEEVGRLLVDRHGAASVTAHTKIAFAVPASEGELKDLAAGCDVVITGIGDCGSCSAAAVTDGIALEAHGIPAAVICSDAFGASADAIAGLRGASGYRYVTTPHPVAVLTPEQVRERAGQTLADVAALLTDGGSKG